MKNIILLIKSILILVKIYFSRHKDIRLVNRILSNNLFFEGLAAATYNNSYLVETGWLRSVARQECIDKSGSYIPWITYAAISFLENRLNKEISVFEYGTGASTLWWANRVKNVISIEHDKSWHTKMKSLLPESVKTFLIELIVNGAYAKKVLEFSELFDIVVIDGRDRVNCAKYSINALKPVGIILWDDTDRLQYAEGITYLLDRGFRRISFSGLSPMGSCSCETSIFYREHNVLGI